MRITIIAQSDHAQQSGGGPLRLKAIQAIYKNLGLDCDVIYQENIKKRIPLVGYLKSLIYGFSRRSLFLKASVTTSNDQVLQLENLKYFNWTFSPSPKHFIYNAHNLEFELFFPGDSSCWAAQRVFSLELRRMRQASLVYVCSEREKNIIIEKDPSLKEKIFILPNLIDKKDYHIASDKKIISFVGTLDYAPNVEAVNFLINDFEKQIPAALFEKYEFIIAGKSPTPELEERVLSSKFTLRKDLSKNDMLDLLAKTYISLVPLSSGSGTRLKIIESLFSGAHVLATPLGAEGIASNFIRLTDLNNFTSELQSMLESDLTKLNQVHLKEEINNYDVSGWGQTNGPLLLEKLQNLCQ